MSPPPAGRRRPRGSRPSARGAWSWGRRCRRAGGARPARPGTVSRPTRCGDSTTTGSSSTRRLGDRGPGLDHRAVPVRGGPGSLVGQVRVHLDLVDRGGDPGLGDDPVEVVRLEVGHADGPCAAVGEELGEHPPGGDVVAVVEGRQRPVDEEQVDVVGAERGEGGVERAPGVVGQVEAVAELAGDPHLSRGSTAGGQALADARARCRTSVRCRSGGSRPRAPRPRRAAVSSGGISKTPKPSWGIDAEPESRTERDGACGGVVMPQANRSRSITSCRTGRRIVPVRRVAEAVDGLVSERSLRSATVLPWRPTWRWTAGLRGHV